MAVETPEDLAGMLSDEDFGVVATVTPKGGGDPFPVTGHLSVPHAEVELGGSVPVSSVSFWFLGRSQDLALAVRESSVDFDGPQGELVPEEGLHLVVAEHQPDGTGMTLLALHEPD